MEYPNEFVEMQCAGAMARHRLGQPKRPSAHRAAILAVPLQLLLSGRTFEPVQDISKSRDGATYHPSHTIITHPINARRSLDFVMAFRHTRSQSQSQRGSHAGLKFEFNTACVRRSEAVSLYQRKRLPHADSRFSCPATTNIAIIWQNQGVFSGRLP